MTFLYFLVYLIFFLDFLKQAESLYSELDLTERGVLSQLKNSPYWCPYIFSSTSWERLYKYQWEQFILGDHVLNSHDLFDW